MVSEDAAARGDVNTMGVFFSHADKISAVGSKLAVAIILTPVSFASWFTDYWNSPELT